MHSVKDTSNCNILDSLVVGLLGGRKRKLRCNSIADPSTSKCLEYLLVPISILCSLSRSLLSILCSLSRVLLPHFCEILYNNVKLSLEAPVLGLEATNGLVTLAQQFLYVLHRFR